MSTERHQKESELPEEPEEPEEIRDLLVLELYKSRDQCCNELGDEGCGQCPVKRKCLQLLHPVEDADRDLSLREYRRLSQRFYALRLERDRHLKKRRGTQFKALS